MPIDTPAEVGRPSDYSPELSDLICSRLSVGESMRSICRDASMPVQTTMFRWLREKPEFRQQYDLAKEESAESHADEMVDIADNQVGSDVDVDGVIIKVIDGPAVAHAKLKIDTRKWAASKLKPKKYGDKTTTEHTGSVNLTGLSDDELENELRQAKQDVKQSTQD